MKEVSFVDTNILVYAYDSEAGRKHGLAIGLMDSLWMAQNGVLSTQVLCEFFVEDFQHGLVIGGIEFINPRELM